MVVSFARLGQEGPWPAMLCPKHERRSAPMFQIRRPGTFLSPPLSIFGQIQRLGEMVFLQEAPILGGKRCVQPGAWLLSCLADV